MNKDNDLTGEVSDRHVGYFASRSFDELSEKREGLIHQSRTVDKLTRADIKKNIKNIEFDMRWIISTQLNDGVKLSKNMEDFLSINFTEDDVPIKQNEEVKDNSLPPKNKGAEKEKLESPGQDEIDQQKNEAIVRTRTIKKLINKNKVISLQLRNIKKYKRGDLTDEEIEQIADDTRKKNGKINYTAMGRVLGVTKDTVRKLINDRDLTHLIDNM